MKKLIRRLSALKSVIDCQDGGMYHEDKEYSQVWLTTTMSLKDIDNWLYKTIGIDYVGVCEK